MKNNGFKRSNNVDSERWDHSGLAELEQEQKTQRRSKQTSKNPFNHNLKTSDLRIQELGDRWAHDKTQEQLSPLINNSSKSKRQSKGLYKRTFKQDKTYSKIEISEEKQRMEQFQYEDANDEGVVSNASTNTSSDKIRLNSDGKSKEQAQDLQAQVIEQEIASTDVSPSSKDFNVSSEPFFELSITFSDENTRELKIYEDQKDLITSLENFCQGNDISEEVSLHVRIYVLKQLSDNKYPDFEEYEDYYKELLEQNFKLLIAVQEQNPEREEGSLISMQKDC